MLFPAFLDLSGKKCLVAGGGAVAERKIIKLVACGADVLVVSPKITSKLRKQVLAGRIEHRSARYRRTYINGAFLVFAATSDPKVNRKIKEDASGRGIPVNVVDGSTECDLIVPASFSRGALEFAVSSSGKAPFLSAKLKEELEKEYPAGFEELLYIAEEAREQVFKKYSSIRDRHDVLVKLIDSEMISLAKRKHFKKIREKVLACI